MPRIDISYQVGVLSNSEIGKRLTTIKEPELVIREFASENNVIPLHVRLIWVVRAEELNAVNNLLARGVRCDGLIICGSVELEERLQNNTLFLPADCSNRFIIANIQLLQKRIERDQRQETDLSEASEIAILAMKNSSFLGDIIRSMEIMADIHTLDDLINTIHKVFSRLDLNISFKIETPDHTFEHYKNEDDEELIASLKNSGRMVEMPNLLLINYPYISLMLAITDDNKGFMDQARDSISVLTSTLSQRIHNIELEEEHLALEKDKDLILATLSHELKTPLHIIKGFSDRLSRKEIDSTFNDRDVICVQKIQENTVLLQDQIEQQLYLYNAMSGNIEVNPAQMSVDELIESLKLKFRNRLTEQKLRFNATVDEAAQFIFIDAEKLNDIVSQLIDNAIKFTHEGEITLNCRRDESLVDPATLLEVSDTGNGIDSSFQKRLFDPFSQEDMSTKRQYGGCGIGLSLVKALCAQLGITISVASKPGAGSTFKLRIPQTGLRERQNQEDLDQDILLF